MKKALFILGAAGATVGVFYLFKNSSQLSHSKVVAEAIVFKKAPTIQKLNNFTLATANHEPISTPSTPRQITNYNQSPIVKFENILDLKQVRSLQLLQTDPEEETWVSDGVLVSFELEGKNGKKVIFTADLIDARINSKNGRVRELELHSTIMSMEDLRLFGVQLHEMVQTDVQPFLTWADKVGNHWMDAPLYVNGSNPAVNNGNHRFDFGVHRTYNDEKPWYFRLLITTP